MEWVSDIAALSWVDVLYRLSLCLNRGSNATTAVSLPGKPSFNFPTLGTAFDSMTSNAQEEQTISQVTSQSLPPRPEHV